MKYGQQTVSYCLEVSNVLNKIPWKKVLMVLYIILVILSVLVVAGFLYLKFGVHAPNVEEPTPPQVTDNINAGNESPDPDESSQPPETPTSGRQKETYTCLIFGEDATSGCTDTIMVATFDVPNQKIGLVSIPRDTKVRTDRSQASCKINAAYSIGGAEQLEKEASELLGIPIDFYIKIRLTAFQKLVDQVGGVWFEVPRDMNYDDPAQNLHIHQKAGLRKLSGEDAMEVVRFRQDIYGNDSWGDTGRASVQQAFLKAMLSQVISEAGVDDIPGLVDVLLNYVDTDAKLNDMLYFGKALVGMDIDSAVNTATLPASWVYPFMIVNKEEALDTINELLNPFEEEITEKMVEFLN